MRIVRAIPRPNRLVRRVGPIPVWGLVLALAGIVTAAVVSPVLTGGPQDITGVGLAFGPNGADPATDGDIESSLALGSVDGWQVVASASGGFAGTIYLRMSMSVGGVQLTCADVFGKVTVQEKVGAGAFVTVAAKELNGAACTSSSTAPAFWFDVSLTTATYPTTFGFTHVWNQFPPSGGVSYSIVAVQ